MITTAILWKKASLSSGARPSTVVKAVSRIGRKREVEASMMASRIGFSCRCNPISSTSTMPLRINMPLKLNRPISAIKPNGIPVSRKPTVTPINASGMVSQMATAFFSELNISTVMMNMITKATGRLVNNPAWASLVLS
ncbi:hypothetical protein D3C75_1103750 [compost metagenome]